ncbi:HPF/RaiA family ribosome-associated protein [Methylophaga sp. OBS4]|uniref:HPF/RaiA family ribosome-associated protein n=1 Tax=Methylophaga sp. OBS4 TaxID=2991935 RepID=UPI00225032D6|nr:HPF/RaiA family ribosome-associated protein [Methylophaga sp. OBS4]MCX4187279.1 HPF/RaiA family ribosome-associated protein [Methylophaga sp. OBS4]
MQLPLQITFRQMEPSEALETKIRERMEELEQFYNQIMSCNVVVEMSHKHHHQGNLFQVRIDLRVPRKELVVSRGPDLNHAHENPYVAVRDAFDAMKRQLEAHSRIQRREVKMHEAPPHGKISVLFPKEDYGRITCADGRDIYFHRNSVVGADFDGLETGMEVRFADEMGEAGPQASSVRLIGKHHIVE